MKKWYEEIFENYALGYDRESFTQGTSGEVDFIEKEIACDRSRRILDIGCGTGRHAIELAKRGYEVTGLDLSERQIARAVEKAREAGIKVDFIVGDAREKNFNQAFDLALMICEGAFSLMETDDMNFKILENAGFALKPGGKLILTTLNALFPLFHSVKEFLAKGGLKIEQNTFDLMTFRDRSKVEFTDDAGRARTLDCDERYYAPSEITWMLKSLGFSTVDIHGARLGKFSRTDPLMPEDYEMLVIADL